MLAYDVYYKTIKGLKYDLKIKQYSNFRLFVVLKPFMLTKIVLLFIFLVASSVTEHTSLFLRILL